MKKYIVLFLALLLMGCAGLGVSTRGEDERIKALEEKVADLENEVLMGMAGGVGTNFYPARSLTGDQAGDLDKITGTSDAGAGDADTAMVTTDENEATVGAGVFFYKLDDDGENCAAESVPACIESGDTAPEWWDLLTVWGRQLKTPQSAVSNDYIDLYEDSDFGTNKQRIDIDAGNDGLAADYTTTLPEVTGTYVLARNGTAGNDYIIENEFVPVGWMDNTGATDPASKETVSTTTNARKYVCRQFDGGSDENLTFNWLVPEDFITTNGIKYQVVMIDTSGGGAAKDIQFELEGESLGENPVVTGDSGDLATFSGAVITSGFGAQITWTDDDILFTDMSAALVAANIPNLAVGELVHFNFNRDVGVTDNYAADVCVIGVVFRYTRALDNNF